MCIKRKLLAVLLTVSVISNASDVCFKADTDTIAHWKFNNNLIDSGPAKLNGENAKAVFSKGKFGQAVIGAPNIKVDGETGFENLSSNFTVKAIFKLNSLKENVQAIIWKRSNKPFHGFLLQILKSKPLFCFYDEQNKMHHIYGPKLNETNLNKWLSVAVSYNGQKLVMMIDDQIVAEKKLKGIIMAPGTANMYIGSAGKYRVLQGEIDEILITAKLESQTVKAIKKNDLNEVNYPCMSDNSMQQAMWFSPADKSKAVPLLVGLHTWSGDYTQSAGKIYYNEAKKRGWAFIFPNFRGPNWTPNAMGSDKAVQDIVDAVTYAKKNANIDPDRIYLCGASGGGFMAMLMAGRHPEIWAGVSAWCGISDIKAWHAYNKQKNIKYFKHIEKALQGKPDIDKQATEEAVRRSPINYLNNCPKLPMDIWHGAKDNIVPRSESENAFFTIVGKQTPIDKIFPEMIGHCKILERKTFNNTRLTIFNSGHTIFYPAAIEWLSFQRKNRPAVWNQASIVKNSNEIEK